MPRRSRLARDATLRYYRKTEPANLRDAISRMEKVKRSIDSAHKIVGLRGTLYTSKAKKEIDKAINFYEKEIVEAKLEYEKRKSFLRGRR